MEILQFPANKDNSHIDNISCCEHYPALGIIEHILTATNTEEPVYADEIVQTESDAEESMSQHGSQQEEESNSELHGHEISLTEISTYTEEDVRQCVPATSGDQAQMLTADRQYQIEEACHYEEQPALDNGLLYIPKATRYAVSKESTGIKAGSPGYHGDIHLHNEYQHHYITESVRYHQDDVLMCESDTNDLNLNTSLSQEEDDIFQYSVSESSDLPTTNEQTTIDLDHNTRLKLASENGYLC